MALTLSLHGRTRATANPADNKVIVVFNFFELGGVGSYTGEAEVQVSTAKAGNGEKVEVDITVPAH